ncbi:MAG: hypothetical protein R2857_04625 [Vampirovibrionales bacterium]
MQISDCSTRLVAELGLHARLTVMEHYVGLNASATLNTMGFDVLRRRGFDDDDSVSGGPPGRLSF